MLRQLVDRLLRRRSDDQPVAAAADRDYTQEREDHRRTQLSEEDQAWAAASRQRDRDKREQGQPPQESE